MMDTVAVSVGVVSWGVASAAPDNDIEAKVAALLARMTLEQKVGQMVQPDIRSVTADDVRKYRLGSVLNGGGAFPGENKHASGSPTGSRLADQLTTTRRWMRRTARWRSRSCGAPMPYTVTTTCSARPCFRTTSDSGPPHAIRI